MKKMNKHLTLLALLWINIATLWAQPANYVWNGVSKNSSESMPVGGGDIGMNVWAESGDILFYLSRTGSYDENNTLLKQGRFRVRLTPNIFYGDSDFVQTLHLNDGYMTLEGKRGKVTIWVDVFKPVVHVEAESEGLSSIRVFYENWRHEDRAIRKVEGQQSSYKWAIPEGLVTKKDEIHYQAESLLFYHKNSEQTVFDVAVAQQGLEPVKGQLYNPLSGLIFGGKLASKELTFDAVRTSHMAETDYKSWCYKAKKPAKKHHFYIALHTAQTSAQNWESELALCEKQISINKDRIATRKWWNDFWKRSYITGGGEASDAVRNYTLFRYMLGCNAFGKDPSKFNGGLFTFDPLYVDEKMPFTPDFRRWGGGTMTAQNQRLVYWPLLKSGDFDLMKPQFDYYLRLLPTAELRTKTYWNHAGACFTEQMENFGLPNPAEYGFKRPDTFDKGMEYNAWLEYQWDTVLEFCQMILETARYAEADITPYLPLIESSLTFFDEHYQLLASQRGRRALDGDKKLIIYPGTACETYKMAHNPTPTIAALRSVLESYKAKPDMLERIPAIPLRSLDGKEMIAPALSWERVNNVETPQLYPVFPWRIYGVGKPDLQRALNTYSFDPDAVAFNSHIGWKQYNIWAACLGMTDEAVDLLQRKLGNGPHRFPAFWGPGYDWTPDLNWGGSGMIGLQEMLLQEAAGKLLLFPAWPKAWDIRFKLHAAHKTTIEVTLKGGQVTQLVVLPKEREADVVNLLLLSDEEKKNLVIAPTLTAATPQ